jgi:hypothetical protein
MTFRNGLLALGAAAAISVGLGTYAVPAWSADSGHATEDMRPMAMGMMMGLGGGDATTAELGVIHELIVNHDRINRTVTNLADGIRTVTESDDPRIAQLIKDHVADMIARVDTRRDPNLAIESDALHSIMRNGDKVKTTVETTDKGSIVTQTSSDATIVAALQDHAGEVSDIVDRGMEAIHTAMMNARGAMQGGMMHRSMMGGPR